MKQMWPNWGTALRNRGKPQKPQSGPSLPQPIFELDTSWTWVRSILFLWITLQCFHYQDYVALSERWFERDQSWLSPSTILAFACGGRCKPENTSVRIAGVPGEIRTESDQCAWCEVAPFGQAFEVMTRVFLTQGCEYPSCRNKIQMYSHVQDRNQNGDYVALCLEPPFWHPSIHLGKGRESMYPQGTFCYSPRRVVMIKTGQQMGRRTQQRLWAMGGRAGTLHIPEVLSLKISICEQKIWT
jgi:hypothetical protein